jgi:hypothetical protein
LEYSNWYFGNNCGATFNTPNGDPLFLGGNKIGQFEGSATISDKNGNLLFYTNGEYVINKAGNFVNIGNPLLGHQSSTQSAIILQKPGSTNLYYIFTADAGEYTGLTNRGINYSIYDIDANAGNGDIVEINNPLLKPASEQLSAVYHANGKDIWVVARGWKNNNFYAYLLTENGITDTVVTQIGFTRTSDFHTIGCLKFSPNGTIAATAVYDEQFFELYKFDNKKGEFYNRIQINVLDQFTLYGVEFSSNGKVLYISSSKSSFGFYSLFQFNLAEYNSAKISQSQLRLVSKEGHIGTLQRGINNKIYLAPLGVKFLHSIENPNTVGVGCRFFEKTVSMLDSASQLGLPQVFKTPLNSKSLSACEGSTITLDPDEFLEDTLRYQTTYKWTGPKGWESLAPRPVLTNIVSADSGTYNLRATFIVNDNPITLNYSIVVKVGKHINFNIIGPDTVCKGVTVNLSADTINTLFNYIWSTGRRSPFMTTSNPGVYKLYITTQFGCVDSAVFKLTVVNPPKVKILGQRLICNNQSIELSSEIQEDGFSYSWSNGKSSPSIIVDEPGVYKLWVMNSNGCIDSSKITVVKYPNLKVKIDGDTTLCVPGTAKLSANIQPFDSTLKYQYFWSTGDSTSFINITKPNAYKLTVVIDDHCVYSDSIVVKKSDSPTISTNAKPYNIVCEGEVITVILEKTENNVKYYWSDGVKTFPRTIKIAGDYIIIAENADGCTSSFPMNIVYKPKPVAEIKLDENTNICNADSLILYAYPKEANYKYFWFTGGNSDSTVVSKSGLYFVVVTNEYGCSDTASINIELGKGLPVRITGNNHACQGDTVFLKANVNFSGNDDNIQYLWSNGSTTKIISTQIPGKFTVTATHTSGCIGKDSVDVKFLEIPVAEVNIGKEITFCSGDSVVVFPKNRNPLWTYYWGDGSLDAQKVIKQSGIYKLLVFNTGACVDSIEFKINVSATPNVKILPEPSGKLCIGDKIILKPSEINNDYKYEWSKGNSKDIAIEVTEKGWYYLKTSNSNSCYSLDSIQILPAEEVKFDLISSKPYLCSDDSLFISAKGNFESIIWSNGDTTSQIVVNQPGIYTASAISVDGCKHDEFIEISIYNDKNTLSYQKPGIEIICPGKTFQNDILINNDSNIEIKILSVTINSQSEFEILKNLAGTSVSAFGSINLPVLFKPTKVGDYGANIKIIYSHICLDSLIIEINGKSNFESIIKLPDLVVESGAKLCIPIFYNFECADSVDFVTSAIMKISFDANYFVPDSLSSGTIIRNEIKNSIRYLEIKFENHRFTSKEGIIAFICGRALLGNDSIAKINIDSFEWEEPLKMTYVNGSLTNQLCAIDIRPVKYFKPTTLSVSPIPSNDFMNITVNSEEKGIFAVEMVDYSGMVVCTFNWSRTESDLTKKQFNVSTENLPSGVYSVRLISPWNVLSSKVIVVK